MCDARRVEQKRDVVDAALRKFRRRRVNTGSDFAQRSINHHHRARTAAVILKTPHRRRHTFLVVIDDAIGRVREQVALFSDPYLEFDQGLVVNVERDPQIKTIDDLHGRVVGIQVGNTSDLVARKLLAEGAI